MEKICTVCGKEASPYKCPKCSFLYCSVACCKVHKEICSSTEIVVITDEKVKVSTNDDTTSTTPILSSSSINDKLSASTRLQSFLADSPYLSTQLPVLLARIDRHDSTTTSIESQLTRDLEKKKRIAEVLKEAIETDPKVAELYQILQDEGII